VRVVANDVYNTPRDVSPSPASTAAMRSLSARGKNPSSPGGTPAEPNGDSSLMTWGSEATGDPRSSSRKGGRLSCSILPPPLPFWTVSSTSKFARRVGKKHLLTAYKCIWEDVAPAKCFQVSVANWVRNTFLYGICESKSTASELQKEGVAPEKRWMVDHESAERNVEMLSTPPPPTNHHFSTPPCEPSRPLAPPIIVGDNICSCTLQDPRRKRLRGGARLRAKQVAPRDTRLGL